MEATAATLPTPAQHGRTRKVASIVTAVVALVLAIAGAASLAGNAFSDDNGYFNTPAETFTSGGYAIAMKSVDISDAPQWALHAGLDSVRVKAHGNRPLFLGIARSGDVQRYLVGTEHDDVSSLDYHPFRVSYDHTAGRAPDRAPTARSFWVKSAGGTGNLTLSWKPRPGNWRAVLMNADGSRGVTAELELEARTTLLWWLGAGLLAAALLAATVAAMLRHRARTS